MNDLIIPGEAVQDGSGNLTDRMETYMGLNIPKVGDTTTSREETIPGGKPGEMYQVGSSTLKDPFSLLKNIKEARDTQEVIQPTEVVPPTGEAIDSAIHTFGELGPETVPEPEPIIEPRKKELSGATGDFGMSPVDVAVNSAKAFNDAATGGLVSWARPDQKPDFGKGWEQLPIGISAAAGFILGGPGKVAAHVGKKLVQKVPWLELIGHEVSLLEQ